MTQVKQMQVLNAMPRPIYEAPRRIGVSIQVIEKKQWGLGLLGQ